MNILLAGNGFDLYHNLPTKYENFLHTMEYIIHHDKNVIIDRPIGDIFNSISEENKDQFIKLAYEGYQYAYDEIYFDENDVDEILSLSNNLWLNYFMEIFDRDLGWIDFEREISLVLNQFRDLFCPTSHRNRLNKIVEYFPFFHKGVYDEYSNIHFKVKKEYEKYDPLDLGVHEPNKEKITDELFNILIDLTKLLNKYLEYFIIKPLKILDNSLENQKKFFGKVDYVVTFNYTNTCELFYSIPNEKVIHIHGKVNDRIILGVNSDETDELNNIDVTFIKFKKYYQRTFLKTDVAYLSFINNLNEKIKSQNKTLNSDALNLIVAGHSLDKTDEDIIKELFELSSNITILCHNSKATSQYITNLISIYGKKHFEELKRNKNLKFVKYDDLK